MPFELFQVIVTFLLMLLVFAWQWLPNHILPFFLCVFAAFFSIVQLPNVFSRFVPWFTALFLIGFFVLFEPFVISDFIQVVGTYLLLVFWWRRQDVSDYLALFVIAVVNFFLTLILQRPVTTLHWGLVPLVVILMIVYGHLVRMRYDMETHTIVKHRLGRQSHRVDVARLLQSRRALDVPVVSMMLAVGALTAALSMGIVHAASPLLGKLHLHFSVAGDFPSNLDLAHMGRPTVRGYEQLRISPLPPSPNTRYWRGQVYDHLEAGVWFRRSFVQAYPLKNACTEYTVLQKNSALKDGFAPLGIIWAKDHNNNTLPISDDGRVHVPPGVSEYRICVNEESGFQNMQRPRAHLKVSKWVLLVARAHVHASYTFHENLQRVLKFLEKYEYSDVYPHVPAGRDPLVHFLFFSRSGPCGLFASVAAVFLDQVGIPVRLVTGFSPGEVTKDGLLFTSKHAHSWLEAWDPNRGWILIDPTQIARQQAWRFGVSSAASSAMMLGFMVALLLLGGIVGWWRWRKKNNPIITPSVLHLSYESRISQTKFEAQMLFHEWLTSSDFASMPRLPGENVRDYISRLETVGHPRVQDVREASSWAARVLFAPISDTEKMALVQKLRSLFLKQSFHNSTDKVGIEEDKV